MQLQHTFTSENLDVPILNLQLSKKFMLHRGSRPLFSGLAIYLWLSLPSHHHYTTTLISFCISGNAIRYPYAVYRSLNISQNQLYNNMQSVLGLLRHSPMHTKCISSPCIVQYSDMSFLLLVKSCKIPIQNFPCWRVSTC